MTAGLLISRRQKENCSIANIIAHDWGHFGQSKESDIYLGVKQSQHIFWLGRGSVVQDNTQKRTMDAYLAVILDVAQLPEFVHEGTDS